MPDLHILSKINEVLKQYHTIEQQLKTTSENTTILKNEFVSVHIEMASLRTELVETKAKVAALEESRNTLREQMERIKAETVAELRAIKAETIGELRAVKAETVAEIKVQQTKYEAELYRKFVDETSAIRKNDPPLQKEPPKIEP